MDYHTDTSLLSFSQRKAVSAFTLIELSIALVIIGLIVGGILVGQSLITAAETRAQLTQIEKYNSAVNTFRGKFNAIPGDMNIATASQFGFTVGNLCIGNQGGRDGNGLLDGYTGLYILSQALGETGLFWQDLSSSVSGNLIEGQYPNGTVTAYACQGTPNMPITGLSQLFPAAKIGHGNFVYVYESSGANWYGVSQVTSTYGGGNMASNANIPVIEAYNMDVKSDDGIPTTGNIQVNYLNASNGSVIRVAPNASSDTASTCYNTTGPAYSVSYNGGTGGNCALSFKMQ